MKKIFRMKNGSITGVRVYYYAGKLQTTNHEKQVEGGGSAFSVCLRKHKRFILKKGFALSRAF
jgi:hypothetical protein